jgi:hypothetical protein
MKSLKSTKDGVQMIISKPPKSFLDLGSDYVGLLTEAIFIWEYLY